LKSELTLIELAHSHEVDDGVPRRREAPGIAHSTPELVVEASVVFAEAELLRHHDARSHVGTLPESTASSTASES
jgi:hypothetical protein